MCCPQYTQRLHLCLTARITYITGDGKFQLDLPLIFYFFHMKKNHYLNLIAKLLLFGTSSHFLQS